VVAHPSIHLSIHTSISSTLFCGYYPYYYQYLFILFSIIPKIIMLLHAHPLKITLELSLNELGREQHPEKLIKSLSNFLRLHVWMFVAIAINVNFECPQLNQLSSLQSLSNCMNLASTLQFCIVYSSEKCT